MARQARSLVEEAEAVFADELVAQEPTEIQSGTTQQSAPDRSGIYAKMAYIMANMPILTPEGQNPHFRYKYWSTDQVTGYFRTRFGEAGVAFGVDVEQWDIREHQTAKEGRSYLTTLLIRFSLTDIDTGETFSGVGIGQGDDPGDKGANKAMAGATKYWLLKTFLMGGEDAEADERTDERAERPQERPVRITESTIEGIGRGGRANKATDAQIRQVREYARKLGWNAPMLASRIGSWLGDEIELPDEPEEVPDALRRYMEGLSAEDAGAIVTHLAEEDDVIPNEPHSYS